MKVYLAASYSRQAEMREVRKRLEAEGHEVTSSWLDSEFASDGEAPPGHKMQVSMKNLADLEEAEALVAFSEKTPTVNSSGGRHVELGYALGTGMNIYTVGPIENVFFWHPTVACLDDLEELVEELSDPDEE